MGTQDGIVIVGGGLAAARVARAFKDAGGEGPVTILSADTDPPYNRPPLSKGFLRGEIEADAVFVEPEEAYAELGIDLRLGCEVTAVEPTRGRSRSPTVARSPTTGSCSRPARSRVRSARPARRSRACTPTARCATRRLSATQPSPPRARS